ncbi:CLUMA_CG004469, isoform A [Clunio marinus]|uniref:CLUMA_CG004469, isoform A n=1 Tax=Clunio marinus TaxID=568069 RepID=A0A1J1HXB6_9DIPT|nr:CLUMA_CG004469, isoform A [Clunio marinus]
MKLLFAFVFIAFVIFAVHTAVVPYGERIGSGEDMIHNIEKRGACRNLTSFDEIDDNPIGSAI